MRCKGKIVEIVKSTIPYTNIMRIECEDGKKVEMLIHDELLNFRTGEDVEVIIDSELPEYKDGIDLCGKGMFYKADDKRRFFSIGGFLVVVWNDENKYEIGKKYYICVLHKEG
ncbi:hypothetical protein IPA_00100 [Ignicoccus pacificus DSM 13166]|uniref:Uncharacterized protein n=1 Tax=Ignicoccus pacificus DSM 13166 TaxID=940294 RepID=A0A977KAA3_9CREN|nr:hypothetical protein IPA_00100 [Ignicoccus pacificus DSM 13166]